MRRHHPLDAEHPAYDPGACGPEGRPLCPRCLSELSMNAAGGFCSAACRAEFKLRSSAAYARQQVFVRDGGICTHCRLDGGRLDRILKVVTENSGEDVACWTMEAIGLGRRGRLISVWQMDHRLAVTEGGGVCGLGNLRTLCLECHKRETRRLHQRMRDARVP